MQAPSKSATCLERIDTRILLCLLVAFILGGIWTVTVLQLRDARENALFDARRDGQGLARVFEEHTVRTIEAADQTVIYLRMRYNEQGKALDIGTDLQQGLNPGHLYNLFSIVDAHGDTVLSSRPFTPTNLSDREHIRVHVASRTDTLFVSKPVLGRVSGKWSIQLTRRISRPDGTFNGVVVASMDPFYFTRLYDEVNLGARSSIAMIGTDGVVRARRVGKVDSIGQDIHASTVFTRMNGRERGAFTERSPVDGVERLYAFEKVTGYPLMILIGLDRDAVLADYVSRRNQSLLLAGAASAAILLFCAALIVLVDRLIASREQAIAANQAKSRFLSNMSHELRTPLNGILGFTELLMEDLHDPGQVEFASVVLSSGRQLLAMVDSVLELSALESEQVQLTQTSVRLADLLERAITPHRKAAADKGLRLAVHIAETIPEVIQCDRVKLLRVLDILLGNAIGFTAAGHVRLSVSQVHGRLQIDVADTGPGVPRAHQDSIFHKFSPADDSASRSRSGAGLGLAIAAQLMACMDGAITLESTPGCGAIFRIFMPQSSAVLT